MKRRHALLQQTNAGERQHWRTSVSQAAIPACCWRDSPGASPTASSMPSSIRGDPELKHQQDRPVIEQAHQLAGQRQTNHKGNESHSRTRP